MKREISITQPEYLIEDWPGKYDVFSWLEYIVTVPNPIFIVTTRKANGAPNANLQSWGLLIGEKGKRPVGFITLDNLLGAVVGEIHDEFRVNENDWLRQPDGALIGKASLPIVSLERALGLEIDNEEEQDGVESVGGLIMLRLGDIPKQGQKIEFPGFDIVVRKMNGPRIVLVKVIPRRERAGEQDEHD
jgi:Mg2+/Co2+ transporter CorB